MRLWSYKVKRRQVVPLTPSIEVTQELSMEGWAFRSFRARFDGVIVKPQEYEDVWIDVRVPSHKLERMLHGNRMNILYIGHLIERLKEHVAFFKA